MSEPIPDFQSKLFLQQQIDAIVDFYDPRVLDISGGFFQTFRNDGRLVDDGKKHLVSSCRLTYMFARLSCGQHDSQRKQHYLSLAQHGLSYLHDIHLNTANGGYSWTVLNHRAQDRTNHGYGLMFVLLAYAWCYRAGISEAKTWLYQTFEWLEQKFWLSDTGLYADEYDADWLVLSDYRGQNVNMHGCEAMLACYWATGDVQFLDRAIMLADNIVNRQTGTTGGLIWEHYHRDWSVDWYYNQSDPKNLYRPWGYQPGHFAEWAKLLVQCYQCRPENWLLSKAQFLFAAAIDNGWDQQHGGLVYGFAPDGKICDDDKYFWVQAESLAAAALLANITRQEVYWTWYQEIWSYCWQNFVDHQHGAWFRLLTRENQLVDDLKATPGGKCDYHTLSACLDCLSVLS
jgi:mannose/cellobiose epimerase-like protein (N-acyl-D-glucosamine 2-epimerase family)